MICTKCGTSYRKSDALAHRCPKRATPAAPRQLSLRERPRSPEDTAAGDDFIRTRALALRGLAAQQAVNAQGFGPPKDDFSSPRAVTLLRMIGDVWAACIARLPGGSNARLALLLDQAADFAAAEARSEAEPNAGDIDCRVCVGPCDGVYCRACGDATIGPWGLVDGRWLCEACTEDAARRMPR
jgi:hypothetical protein